MNLTNISVLCISISIIFLGLSINRQTTLIGNNTIQYESQQLQINNLEDQIYSLREINQKLLIKDKKHYGTTSTDNESNR